MARHVTIFDVAERAGVALSSASTALNGRPGVSEATRERVRTAARELGYVPSLRGRSLSAGRAYAVAFVVQRDSDVLESDPFFATFIAGVESVLSLRGYALVLQMAGTEQDVAQRYRDLAAYRRVDGVLLNELQVDDPRIPLLTELDLPTVAVNAQASTDAAPFPFPEVRQDGVAAVRELVHHLAGLGHRRIAHVTGPPQFVHSRERLVAWRQAVRDEGLEPGPLVVGDFTYPGGEQAAATLLALDERPTAVFCANDLSAAGFIRRAQDLGLEVPRDLSVAGFDGIALGTYTRPTLTTVVASPRLLATHAAEMLLDLVEGKTVDDVQVPPATVVVRGSTGPAPRDPVA